MGRGIIVFIVLVSMAGAVWWYVYIALGSETNQTAQSTPEPKSDSGLLERVPSASDRQVYINQDWRFSFEYPSDWELDEPSLKTRASMLKVTLKNNDNNFPDPITVHTFPKWWIDRLLPEIAAQENSPPTILVDSRMAVVGSFVSHSVINSAQYYVLINDEYWYGISGKIKAGEVDGYAEELEIVRSSFRFHEPLPSLENLDVEPYMPDHVNVNQ